MKIKRIMLPIVIIVAGVGSLMGLSSMREPPEEKPQEEVVPIVAVKDVTLGSLSLDVSSYGVMLPKYETQLIAQVSGQIVELSDTFVRGGFVEKGQLLAQIDPSDYEAALVDAEANLASAQAALELEKAQGKVAEREWQRIKDTSPTELSLRKPQLAQEMARVKAAEAAVKRARRNLDRTKIIAPYHALISDRTVGLGAVVGMGNPMGTIMSVDTGEIRLPVANNQLRFLNEQGVGSTVNLMSDQVGKDSSWQGTIVRSEGVIDNQSRMSYLVVEVNDPYGLKEDKTPLKFGTYLNATIEGIKISDAAIIPRHLVQDKKIAIMNNNDELEYRAIKIMRQQGKSVVVNQGLHNGDRIITSAMDYPLPGMKLALLSDEPSQPLESETDDSETQVALGAN
ncbi:efflux RND transporter periplasmic adaptor subunit [Thalassotalea sp. PS06]|uniref:efflux RND transporter periplasmic adaptor subunit n=1 Tax=Thalassotalea sp. PS06 TaxID=2594005 RepID=UPI0028C4D2D2|nr:efflux RND transporter periplasmic adaptor subunit [Thalassotalea sp. PS06]